MFETIAVAVIVLGAVAWIGRRFIAIKRGGGGCSCGDGKGGCRRRKENDACCGSQTHS